MKLLALIPARGGSKRLPRKNIKLLGGLPLISWTIITALKSECFIDVVVSTDDAEIAEVSKRFGASVPWLRPKELALDSTSSVDMCLHAVESWEHDNGRLDGVMLLQPTSPFRTSESLRNSINLFIKHSGAQPVVSFSQAKCHPVWCFQNVEGRMESFFTPNEMSTQMKYFKQAWAPNGLIYLISPTKLREHRSFITSDVLPLFIDNNIESLDIDYPDDFYVCECVMKSKNTIY